MVYTYKNGITDWVKQVKNQYTDLCGASFLSSFLETWGRNTNFPSYPELNEFKMR